MPDTPRAAKSREEDRAPYLLLVRARLAVLRQELQDLVDARLLRLPHGRRGRRGHGLAAAASVSRLVRPVLLTRRRRSDDRVVTRERRNRQAARATRCDARSPHSIADPLSIGARHASVASWRRAVTVPIADANECPPRKRLFSGRPEKGSAVHVRALVRSCPTAHAPRVPSRDARTMRRSRRSPSAYPRTCCGSSRCVSRSSAAGVHRLPAIPKRAFLFRGRRQRVAVTHARIASVRPRGVPSRTARTSAHSRALFSPPRSHVFPTRALPRNRVATPDAFDARCIVRSKGHRRVDLAPRCARAASFRFPLGAGLPRQRPSGRAHAISAL